MSELSEAEGLLRSGALYPRRVGLRRSDGLLILVGWKHGAVSIYFGDAPFYHLDLQGRWQRAFVEGTHYLKGLDASVEAIDRVREGENLVLRRRTLSFAEASDLDASVRSMALDLITELESGTLQVEEPPEPARPSTAEELRETLESISRWDAAAWFSHRERYLGTYGPWPFLPPDCPHAAVLQGTLGHVDGRAFAGSEPSEHYVRDAKEFEEHARTVDALLGARVVQCRNLFLAGADVLRRPIEELQAFLEIAARVFPIARGTPPGRLSERPLDEPYLEAIAAFLDDFSPPVPDRSAWTELRAKHLRKVCLGVESGSPKVRALNDFHWTDAAFLTLADDLKNSGIRRSFVVPVGVGGVEHRADHEARTTELFQQVELGPGDLIYLIDAAEISGATHYQETLQGLGLTPLDGQGREASRASLKQTIGKACCGRGAKVAHYSLSKQPV